LEADYIIGNQQIYNTLHIEFQGYCLARRIINNNMSRPQSDLISPSDPALAASCLDFLLIELVPLAQRITDQLHARDQALKADFKRSQIFSKQTPQDATTTDTTTASTTGATDTTTGGLSDETKEAMFWRLDGMGYRVGQGLVER